MHGQPRQPALWRAVVDAASGHRRGAAGTAAALAAGDGAPRLAWVRPASWERVAHALAPFAGILRARRIIFVGTGGWAFAARAIAEVSGRSAPLRVVDVLDPEALAAAVCGPDEEETAAVAVSESGLTVETATLAAALRDQWGIAAHWLTAEHLSLDPAARTVALFAAPVSVPFALAAAAATSDRGSACLDRFAGVYEAFAGTVDAIGGWAASEALRVPPGRVRVRVEVPRNDGLGLFARQALRQGLGGKCDSGPWFDIGTPGGAAVPDADVVITLPGASPHPDPLVRLMAGCYAVCALVACLGVRHRIAFATHPSVTRYKELLGKPGPDAEPVDADRVISRGARWLVERRLAAGHLVCYEPRLTRWFAGASARLATLTGRPWETHAGSTWNHHSYQAVYSETGIGVVVVMPASESDVLSRTQADIARATSASLGERALLLRPAAANPHERQEA